MSERDREAVHPIVPDRELPPEAGGKAHGLRLIASAGLHVPPAWAVLRGAGPADLAALATALEARGVRSLAVRSSAAEEDDGGARGRRRGRQRSAARHRGQPGRRGGAGVRAALAGRRRADATGAVLVAPSTDLLRDGDVVRVDGSRGVVEVISRARPGEAALV
jgi:hypothetical protein